MLIIFHTETVYTQCRKNLHYLVNYILLKLISIITGLSIFFTISTSPEIFRFELFGKSTFSIPLSFSMLLIQVEIAINHVSVMLLPFKFKCFI